MTDNTNRQTIEDSQPQVSVVTNSTTFHSNFSNTINSTIFSSLDTSRPFVFEGSNMTVPTYVLSPNIL